MTEPKITWNCSVELEDGGRVQLVTPAEYAGTPEQKRTMGMAPPSGPGPIIATDVVWQLGTSSIGARTSLLPHETFASVKIPVIALGHVFVHVDPVVDKYSPLRVSILAAECAVSLCHKETEITASNGTTSQQVHGQTYGLVSELVAQAMNIWESYMDCPANLAPPSNWSC